MAIILQIYKFTVFDRKYLKEGYLCPSNFPLTIPYISLSICQEIVNHSLSGSWSLLIPTKPKFKNLLLQSLSISYGNHWIIKNTNLHPHMWLFDAKPFCQKISCHSTFKIVWGICFLHSLVKMMSIEHAGIWNIF